MIVCCMKGGGGGGTLKCENTAICKKVAKCEKKNVNAKCENWRYLWKNYAKCEKNEAL